MKKLLHLLVTCFFAGQAIAQSVSESKNATNSILLRGSAITLNITEPSLRLDLQKNELFKKSRNNGYILGISAQGSNESGVAGIFSEGELVPAVKITGLAGFTFSNNVTPSEIEKLQVLENEITNEILPLLESIKDERKKKGLDTTAIQKRINLKNIDRRNLLNKIEAAAISDTQISYWKTTVFGYGGIAAKTFKHFIGYDPTDLLKSFTNENFRGGFGGIGVNHQYRNLQFGATFGYVKNDNQSLLTQKTYNYEKVTTVNNQTIKESKEIKAFGGTYGTVSYYSLNVDFIANISLDGPKGPEEPRNFMYINPYMHTNFGSTDKDVLPNTTNVGLGLYLFNSKSVVIGGVYLELPDISNNIEKSKVAADRNIRPALQKLSFGIITKFKLSSFMPFLDL